MDAKAPESEAPVASTSEPEELVEPIVGLKNCTLLQQGAEAVSAVYVRWSSPCQ